MGSTPNGFDRLSPNGCGGLHFRGGLKAGKFGALEGFAFNLVVEFAHAPVRLDALLRIKPACRLGFQGKKLQKMRPAQMSHQ